MKSSPGATSPKNSRKTTFVFVAICCMSLAVAFLVGISDNPPGLVLCYVATTALILAFAYAWRKSKNFVILLGASLIGFPLFVVLHNVFYAVAEVTSDIAVLRYLFEFLHAGCFLMAIFVCPAGLAVGIVGTIATAIMYFKKKQTIDRGGRARKK